MASRIDISASTLDDEVAGQLAHAFKSGQRVQYSSAWYTVEDLWQIGDDWCFRLVSLDGQGEPSS